MVGLWRTQFTDRGCLGDGDVVQGSERTEHHAGEDEALQIDAGGTYGDEECVFVLGPGEVSEVGEQVASTTVSTSAESVPRSATVVKGLGP